MSLRSIIADLADRIRGEKKAPPPEGGGEGISPPPGRPPYGDRGALDPRFSEREAPPSEDTGGREEQDEPGEGARRDQG